jgi:hypothetical protein
VKLIEYIQAIEKAAGKEAILDLLPSNQVMYQIPLPIALR